jgi:intein/homing endonuclease
VARCQPDLFLAKRPRSYIGKIMTDTLADLRGIKLPFDLDSVREQCHDCVRKQLKKYEKAVDENDKSLKGRFTVPCTGIPKHYIDPKYDALFPNEKIREAAEEAADITKWAANNLKLPNGEPWVARWYQAEVLRCSSRRKVLRISRRCLVSDSKVLMGDGLWKNIQDILPGDIIATRNRKNQLVSKKVLNTFNNGVRDVYKIRLSNGMSVRCTSNHPLLAFEKVEGSQCIRKAWTTIEDGLSVGTKVVVFKGYDKWGEEDNRDLCAFLGYMITDGYFGKPGQTPKFTNNNIRMIDEVRKLTGLLFGYEGSTRRKGNGYDFHITDGNKRTSNKFVEFLKENGLFETKASRKFIPDIVYRCDKESQMALVNRMFSGDGNVSYWENGGYLTTEVGLCSVSKSLLSQVRLILLKVGVESYISKETRRIKNDTVDSVLYKLRISRATSIENFFEHVGLIYGKEEISKKVLAIAQGRKKRRRPGSIQFRYETIKSIEKYGESRTHDVEVEDHHNFITDGILVHNSGKTDSVCVEICYYLFTEPSIQIIVAGPQKSHTEEIITRVREFIKSNPALSAMVTRDVSAPWYEIKISHGKKGTSRLRGFAAGTKGKGGATGIRGQDAHRIYLEEMDYIEETSINRAILPILHTTPHTALVGFSTPSGFQTPYYRLCEENPMYKEYHFSYKVIPHWKSIEQERSSFTEEDWTHEYCLGGDIRVYANGEIKKIRDIKRGDVLLADDANSFTKVAAGSRITEENADVLTIKTWSSDIICTPDHNFKDIPTGQKVCAADAEYLYYKPPLYKYTNRDEGLTLARLVGHLNGDGCVGKRIVKKHKVKQKWYNYRNPLTTYHSGFHSVCKEDVERILLDIKAIFRTEAGVRKKKTPEGYEDGWMVSLAKENTLKLIELGAVVGKKAEQSFDVPQWIQDNKEYMKEYIAALFGSEGSTPREDHYGVGTISLSMMKRNRIPDVHLRTIADFLISIGIETSLTTSITNKHDGKERTITCLYVLSRQENIRKFAEEIGFRYCKDKEVILFKFLKYFDYCDYLIGKREEIIRFCLDNKHKYTWKFLAEKFGVSTKTLCKSIHSFNKTITRRPKSKLVGDVLKAQEWMDKYSCDDYIFQPILLKERAPRCDVYNITVDSADHSYLLEDGLVTYNCAEWGDTEAGVYKPAYIDRALRVYKYNEAPRSYTWKYCIGTDWNEKHGTEIVVLGYNTAIGKFQVVETVLVAGSEFTQLSGISKLLDLNRKWKPAFIYIDAGGGSTNYELLRKTAHENQRPDGDRDTARLLYTLKKYDAGSAIKIKDPITGKEVKAPAKPFMVNASVRMFEQGKISISSSDHVLEKQLRSYIIERYTPTKVPVYSLQDPKVLDHRLDALNLAIVAFHLEFDDLHMVNVLTDVAAIADPRTGTEVGEPRGSKMSNAEHFPEDRRLETPDRNSPMGMMPGKVDSGVGKTKTNRAGWDTDQEEQRKREWLQRRRSRGKVQRNRPSRSNI